MLATLEKPAPAPDLSVILVENEPDLQKEPFRVDSLEKAQWAAQRYLDAERRIQERSELADRYIRRICDWMDRSNKEDQDSLGYFRMVLRPWVQDRLTGVRSRSLILPGIRLGFRKKPDRVEITNPLTALDFCETKVPGAVVIKKELSKTELKRVLGLGVTVPGVELVPGEDELSVKED